MHWVPVFLALQHLVAVLEPQASRLLSYRQSAYDEWPRTGIPITSRRGRVHAHGRAARGRRGEGCELPVVGDPPALRYPTLELRICDACTRLERHAGDRRAVPLPRRLLCAGPSSRRHGRRSRAG
jgi:carboxylate-amine ligase